MTRDELIKSEGYWIAKLQTELYREINAFKEKRHMNNTQLAEHLGCSKGYITQLLSGNFDHKLSKLVELSLAIGKVPVLYFQDISKYLENEGETATSKPNVHNGKSGPYFPHRTCSYKKED
ncbi:MAG: hypothetical protein KBS55_01505 [Bacteroidales bacterium]|nr:hypothetical protein [Candidatus Cryptobacteroides aphodequi]